jgi:sigma-E factor negative regulatory protein RseB
LTWGLAGNEIVRLLLVLLLVVSGESVARESARQWLDDMSAALQTLNYDGTFVYLHDGKLEAMRIIHRMDQGGQRERLVSLTGSAREVLRDDKSVTCIMPDNKSVMVGQSRPPQPFPVVPRDLDSVSPYYLLEDVGDDRMAGYEARVIAITPRDGFRYGYRFWIARDTGMLLKSDLTDVDGKPIEQMMFTRLSIGDDIPAGDLQPSLTGDGFSWHSQMNTRRKPGKQEGKPAWRVGKLPAGFSMTHFQRKRMRDDSTDAQHMVFSDGLATVSAYVENTDSVQDPLVGLSSMGAMNAYGVLRDGFQVTVVGEVPPATVEMIATSLNLAGADE